MIENNIDNTLAKLFSKEKLTASEEDELLAWKNTHEEEFKNLSRLHNSAGNTTEHLSFDVDAAWEKINRRAGKNKVIDLKPNYFKWIAVAATVLLAVGVYIFFSGRGNDSSMQLVKTDATSTKTISLKDGSKVVLNKNSSLSFDDMKHDRIVTLTGEAYFDVAHDDAKPFVVKTPNASVKVLGTAFNIKTTEASTKVNVERGKVELSANDKRTVLIAGEEGKFENQQLVKQHSSDENYLSWKTGKLIFKESSLAEVVAALQEYHHVKIIINDSKAVNCKVTTTFSSETITQALNELKLLLHFKYGQTGDTIIISDTDCN